MLITKREEITKQGFCKILWRKLRLRESLLLEFIHSSGWRGVRNYLSLIGGRRGWRLLTFSAFRMGAYSRWVLIRGWALIRINTVFWVKNKTITVKRPRDWKNKFAINEVRFRHGIEVLFLTFYHYCNLGEECRSLYLWLHYIHVQWRVLTSWFRCVRILSS